MSQVHEINFKGAHILGVKQNGVIFVPIPPICNSIGIDVTAQRQRISRDPILSKGGCILQCPSVSSDQDMLCLPLHRVHYWLAGISTGSIKTEEMRERVIEFKEECADVLFAYFMPELARTMGIKLPTFEARLLQDDLLERDAATPDLTERVGRVEQVATEAWAVSHQALKLAQSQPMKYPSAAREDGPCIDDWRTWRKVKREK